MRPPPGFTSLVSGQVTERRTWLYCLGWLKYNFGPLPTEHEFLVECCKKYADGMMEAGRLVELAGPVVAELRTKEACYGEDYRWATSANGKAVSRHVMRACCLDCSELILKAPEFCFHQRQQLQHAFLLFWLAYQHLSQELQVALTPADFPLDPPPLDRSQHQSPRAYGYGMLAACQA
jgi:hypothetical protein